jgi:predicted dehydrogenase
MNFRICEIGGGWMATQGHGPSYQRYAQENPEVELAACCDISPEAAREFQQKFGFTRYYTDIFEMLDQEKPDAVCLTVPVHLTADLAVRIMEAGYPVMMVPGERRTGMDAQVR